MEKLLEVVFKITGIALSVFLGFTLLGVALIIAVWSYTWFWLQN